jgi:hypothetical protein
MRDMRLTSVPRWGRPSIICPTWMNIHGTIAPWGVTRRHCQTLGLKVEYWSLLIAAGR